VTVRSAAGTCPPNNRLDEVRDAEKRPFLALCVSGPYGTETLDRLVLSATRARSPKVLTSAKFANSPLHSTPRSGVLKQFKAVAPVPEQAGIIALENRTG
jgi:hypothetical protein